MGELLEARSSKRAWVTRQDPVSTDKIRHSGGPVVPATWEVEVGKSLEP